MIASCGLIADRGSSQDGLGALVAVILPVMLPSYVNIYRSKTGDEIYYSCNVNDTVHPHARLHSAALYWL